MRVWKTRPIDNHSDVGERSCLECAVLWQIRKCKLAGLAVRTPEALHRRDAGACNQQPELVSSKPNAKMEPQTSHLTRVLPQQQLRGGVCVADCAQQVGKRERCLHEFRRPLLQT